ncbi:hypothetical protein KEM52_006018 [Ascosphaera acerosa]|nr:hypothetical protein KEM52_006018 [Ascosphaera acerosa]
MSYFRKGRMSDKDDTTEGVVPVESHSSAEGGAFADANANEKGFGDPASKAVQEERIAEVLEKFRKAHKWDPNMDDATLQELARKAVERDVTGGVDALSKVMDDSPYPEVRAAVRNYDEDLPVNTIRMWFLAMLLNTIASALNALFALRAPSISIMPIVIQLVAYPCAWVWDMVMPNHQFSTFGIKWNLNPGPFNIKEHAAIVIMANAAFGGGTAYFTDTLTAQKIWYKHDLGIGWDVCFALSTQLTGFAIAGIMRKWLVEAGSMIWPSNLVNTAFMYALHDRTPTDPATTNGWKISRYRFFLYAFLASFVWYWFPGFIAPFLSVFAWVTWIKPNNAVINQVFGGASGMSLIPITFDWSQVAGYVLSPLMFPFHAIGNTVVAMVLWFWVVAPAIHFTGVFEGKHLPMSDSNTYDNTGAVYNVTKILTSEYTLDEAKYHNYSPLYMSTTFILSYGLSFGAVSAAIVHTIIYNGREIVSVFRAQDGDIEDIHTRLMKKYKQVPWWWFAILGVITTALCFVSALVWDTHLTWWAVIVSLCIPLIFTVPFGMIQGATNVQLGLNVLTEFMVGYMLPGKPLAMMMFKTFGYITMSQALGFVQDMKLGYYLKVPPVTMFWTQLVGTFWSALVQLGTILWAFGNIEGVCQPDQPNHYTCPNGKVFFNASVIWGLIGPGRLFSAGSLYGSLQWFWLAGAVCPVIAYVVARKWPKSGARFFSAPLLFGGTGQIPPATPLNYLSWAIIGTIFNKYIRNKYRGWWSRYNYVLSGALDSGLAICTILIFLTLGLTQTEFPSWWGTRIAEDTMDMAGTAVLEPMAPGQKFGASSWH